MIAAVMLAAGAVAYACTSLATLDLESKQAAAGQTVDGSGEGFSGNPTASEVQIHFDNQDGQVLWSGRPDVNGDIAFSLTTPEAAPGDYVLIATQTTASGDPVYGTPARASFEVVDPGAGQNQGEPAPAEQQPEPQPEPAPAEEQPAEQDPAPAEQQAEEQPAQQPAPAAVGEQPAAQDAPAAEAEAPAAAEEEQGEAAEQPAANEQAPAAERSATMESQSNSQAPMVLALGLIGVGVLLTLGTTAFALARRREAKAPAHLRS